jgi:hypothetical protein
MAIWPLAKLTRSAQGLPRGTLGFREQDGHAVGREGERLSTLIATNRTGVLSVAAIGMRYP